MMRGIGCALAQARKSRSFGAELQFARQPQKARIPIEAVEALNKRKGYHFFDADSKRFFLSRNHGDAYKVGGSAYFITSEKHESMHGSEPRAYTVRGIDLSTGQMVEVSKFQEYPTLKDAQARLRREIL